MIKRNKGHFLVVSSAAGFFGSPLMVDYSSSKVGGPHNALCVTSPPLTTTPQTLLCHPTSLPR